MSPERFDIAFTPPLPRGTSDGTLGPMIPPNICRLCWRERLVWRDDHWWLEHIGSYDSCSHPCHDCSTFMESTS